MTKQELLDLIAEAPAEYREVLELVKTLITDLPLIDVADDSDGWFARDTSTGNDVRMTVAKVLARAIKSGSVQSLDSGPVASRPLPGDAGVDAWYLSDDEPRLYRSTGTAWEAVLGTAAGLDVAAGETVDALRGAASLGVAAGETVDALRGAASLTREEAAARGFHKTDSTKVSWTKTGNDTAETNQDLTVFVGGDVVSVPPGTSIAMPTLTAGTDYAIWCAPDGTLEADESYTVAPTAGGRRVGGFHYAPGGNASFEINAGDGDTTPQISEYSFHDLKWKPSAPDPRGLTLVGDGAFWWGIYHLAQDHLAGPPHRHGVSPARDGNAPQLITGVGNYPDAQAMNIFEVLQYHGFRSPRVEELQLAAFGTNEEASRGSDPVLTGLNEDNVGTESPDEVFTSHWGVIQSTGVISHWSNDSILSTADQTLPNPSRGGRFWVSRFAYLGGHWNSGADSGSRYVSTLAATLSRTFIGGRGCCDHVIID